MPDENNKIQPIKEKTGIAVRGSKPSELKARIAEEVKIRDTITEYINSRLKKGVDFGTIEFETKSGKKIESKPSLFKPGSEKFCSLFQIRPTFTRDDDTWEMAGKPAGLFCFVCKLLAPDGSVVGEGRGTARLSEKLGWTENNAVKIAEKRAQIDAVLRTGGLSDFFTQDLEDMGDAGSNKKQTTTEPLKPRLNPKPLLITQHQKNIITTMLMLKGKDKQAMVRYVQTKFGVDDPNKLSIAQANELIKKLESMPDYKPDEMIEPAQTDAQTDALVDEIIANV